MHPAMPPMESTLHRAESADLYRNFAKGVESGVWRQEVFHAVEYRGKPR